MTTSAYLALFLKSKNIQTIFEMQGGMITRILDEFNVAGGFNIVTMHHEQAASFAVDAFARVKGIPCVALATSGPGATNLITGIGSCYFDSVPAIFITGQVNLKEQKGDNQTRQIGFQETDIVEIIKPITKAAYAVTSAAEIPELLEKAYNLAIAGRPGPVLIDIPMNIQKEEIGESAILFKTTKNERQLALPEIELFYNQFLSSLKCSKKPLILVGRGVKASLSNSHFIDFAERHNIPVVTSLLGLDTIPYQHHLRVGFIGTYGNRWANYAVGNSDLLLVLGSRLDLRQTGADVEKFKLNKRIFHVDIDKAEINNRVKADCSLNANLYDFFIHSKKLSGFYYENKNWINDIKQKKEIWPDTEEFVSLCGINPNKFMHALSKKSKSAKGFTTDVGNNQMWSAQSLELSEGQFFLSSGGMGSMGYSLPAAIGACYAVKNQPIVCISGDGGFQINIQELQTIKQNNLPIKIIVLNNNCLGMIRQFQDSYFDSRYQSTVWGYSAPDFTAVSKAYGIDSITINMPDEIENALDWLWKDDTIPKLLNVVIDTNTNAYPKTEFGKPITEMEPNKY